MNPIERSTRRLAAALADEWPLYLIAGGLIILGVVALLLG